MDELLQLLITFMEQIEGSFDQMDDDEAQEISEFLIEVMTFMMEQQKLLGAQQPSPTVPQRHEIPAGEFPSSNVNGFFYDPKKSELYIQFHGPYPQAAGPKYVYSNVPKFIFDIISRGAIGPKTSGANAYHRWIRGVTPSLGGSVNALLKAGNFPYQKIA